MSFLEASEGVVKIFGERSVFGVADVQRPIAPIPIDLLGSTAFAAVISDMNGNIKVCSFDSIRPCHARSDTSIGHQKVRAYYDTQPDKAKTLESLVISEKNEKKKDATQGLLWLLRCASAWPNILAHDRSSILHRGLHFTLIGLQNSWNNKSEELTKSFNDAYGVTLKQYHNFVVKGVFTVRDVGIVANYFV